MERIHGEFDIYAIFLNDREQPFVYLSCLVKGLAQVLIIGRDVYNRRDNGIATLSQLTGYILCCQRTDGVVLLCFIDEVQHNDFITPELLKHIRDSKFVVVDLTHQNNGAYFEEGYAMGLGKQVIQLCKDGVELHFDIAQKNTIMWNYPLTREPPT